MKTTFFYAAIAVFLLVSMTSISAQEQKRIDLDAFNELMIGGDFNVILTNNLSGGLILKGSPEAIE